AGQDRVFRGAEGRRVSSLTALNLAEARAGLRAKDFSARELTAAYIAAVAAARPLNAFITETPERALQMAADADARLAAGAARPLRSPPVPRLPRPAPTPAALSASRRAFAASSG